MHNDGDCAVCRGCGTKLVDWSGKPARPYYTGNTIAYHPDTKYAAKTCYYGGFVCSRGCDWRSCLELEESMPGHAGQRSVSSDVQRKIEAKWGAQ